MADKVLATQTTDVAICGNPNCGKTTVFNAITGLRQKVGNYSGVTVEKVTGQFQLESHPDKNFNLIDIPGTYSLAAFSPDEYIAAQALFGSIADEAAPDIIICVIDATNLERGLYFLYQVMQIGCPIVVALNMIDLADRRGLSIDAKKLSHLLGDIPVVPVIGSKGQGIEELKKALGESVENRSYGNSKRYDSDAYKIAEDLFSDVEVRPTTLAEQFRILYDENGQAEQEFASKVSSCCMEAIKKARVSIKSKFGSLSAGETFPLTKNAAELFKAVVTEGERKSISISDKIDKVLLHPIIGPILLISIMTLIFQSIFSWAEPLMGIIDTLFSAVSAQVELAMDDGPLRSLLIDGIIGGVGSVLIFLPQIIILFLFVSLLEDSGYMPRAAFLVDRAFGWCGLSGKSFIPMLSSFACAIPGIMATRTIEDRKLRFITIIVSPLMSCSARLPVYAIMIAAFVPHKTYLGIFNSQGIVLASLYGMGIVVAVIVSFILNKLFLKTERGSFLMEMPSYKVPTPISIFIRVFSRAKSFVFRAGTVIFAITVIIWAMSYYPRSEEIAIKYQTQTAEVEALYESRVSDNQNALSPDVLFEEKESAVLAIANEEAGANLRNSYFARIGKVIEPLFLPLGWDWKITMATLASFPAREVIIATLGTIYNLGAEVNEEDSSLMDRMKAAKWEDGPRVGQPVYTLPVALSIMVFFALCCQCGATLVTIRQETNSWLIPAGVFLYMTVLAYVAALIVYQVASGVMGW